jgi:hypothetical protein
MNQINIKTTTTKVGEYNIDQMIEMFGKRIDGAIYTDIDGHKGLNLKQMYKICKKWKFWNKDIRLAYNRYYGYCLAPNLIINEMPEIAGEYSNEMIPEKVVKNKYH